MCKSLHRKIRTYFSVNVMLSELLFVQFIKLNLLIFALLKPCFSEVNTCSFLLICFVQVKSESFICC